MGAQEHRARCSGFQEPVRRGETAGGGGAIMKMVGAAAGRTAQGFPGWGMRRCGQVSVSLADHVAHLGLLVDLALSLLQENQVENSQAAVGRPSDPHLQEAACRLGCLCTLSPAHLLHLVDAVSCPGLSLAFAEEQRTQPEAGTQSSSPTSLTTRSLPTQATPTGPAAMKVGVEGMR